MTQLRRDAAYIRTEARLGDAHAHAKTLTEFDEEVYELLSTPHTVISATKALSRTEQRSEDPGPENLESRVADSMLHLLHAERIELSPDS